MKIDHEFAALCPPLQAEELAALENSIAKEGCRDALVLWHDLLLDGHHRERICRAHNIPFKTMDIELPDRDEAKIWILRNQFARRNLTPFQRAELALKLEPLIAGKAQEKRRESGGAVPQKSAKPPIDTRKEVAKLAGVSHDTIAKAKTISAEADEETKAKLRRGETSINREAKRLKQDKNLAVRQKRMIQEAKGTPQEQAAIKLCDCSTMLTSVTGIDLLLTDPPYFTDGNYVEAISAWLHKVKPTGQAYVFASAAAAEVGAYLGMDCGKMVLAQILSWNYNNAGQRQPNDKYKSNFQVVFYFRGPQALHLHKPADGTHQYACQTVNAPDGRIGDRFHEWQKPQELIERYIRNSSAPGDFVFDPFAGTGTTLLAAAKLGRRTLGCEIDEAIIRIAVKRGCIRAI